MIIEVILAHFEGQQNFGVTRSLAKIDLGPKPNNCACQKFQSCPNRKYTRQHLLKLHRKGSQREKVENKKSFLLVVSLLQNHFAMIKNYLLKAELRQSFSMCVYCMRLCFQSNYAGLSQRTLKTTVATQLQPSYFHPFKQNVILRMLYFKISNVFKV